MTDSAPELVGTGKHLSATELRLWTGFLDASRIIESELSRQLNAEFAMTHREYEVLVRVDGAGGQMRLRTLSRQIEASPQLVTQTVDRLVAREWLTRQPSAEDRRGVEASITPLGSEKLAAAAGPHAELVRRLLIDPVGSANIAPVADSIARVADHLRSHRSGGSCVDPTCPLA